MTKKIFFLSLIIAFLLAPGISLAQVGAPAPPQPGPVEKRPDPCLTNVEGTVSNSKRERCASMYEEGRRIHLWHEPSQDPEDENLYYVSISRWVDVASQSYIYQARDKGIYFMVRILPAQKSIYNYKHFIKGAGLNWNDTPNNDIKYDVLNTNSANLVEPSGIKNGTRYSFRVVISGDILFEGQKAEGANVIIALDNEQGPPIALTTSNNEGRFVISDRDDVLPGSKKEEIWVSDDTVDNLILYTRYEKNGLKYEKSETLNYASDFTLRSGQGEVVELLNKQINLGSSNQVSEFTRNLKSDIGIVQEVTGSLDWQNAVMKWVVCKMANAFISVLYWESNLAAYFLRRNY